MMVEVEYFRHRDLSAWVGLGGWSERLKDCSPSRRSMQGACLRFLARPFVFRWFKGIPEKEFHT